MKFTKIEKILLLEEIKKRPILWNKKSKDHNNSQLVKKAWNQISQILMKSELDCKKCFQSLRNCQRYQRNKQQQQLQLRQLQQQSFPNNNIINKLTAKYTGENFEIGGSLNEWEMDQYLSFLPDKHGVETLSLPNVKNSSTPKPIQLFKSQETETINNIDDGGGGCVVGGIDFENNNGFVYSYVTSSDLDRSDDIASSSLVNDVWNSSLGDQFQSQEVLKYDGMLRNIDWLLQKLPETDVIDLNMQFIKLIYDKLQQNDEEGTIKTETIC